MNQFNLINKARLGLLLSKVRRCMMDNENEKLKGPDVDEIIFETFEVLEQEREQKLVNLIIEIIVSSTLKEYYEKGN